MRGVNKTVMEITNDNEYIEKAILFIKQGKTGSPQHDISLGAESFLSDIADRFENKRENAPSPIIMILAGIAAGSVVSWIAALLIGII